MLHNHLSLLLFCYNFFSEDKLVADMQEVFSQSIFMVVKEVGLVLNVHRCTFYLQCAYGVNPDISDERVSLAQWNNCAYVISSLGKLS